jgi:LytS/YehU family sensor histidine kinase
MVVEEFLIAILYGFSELFAEVLLEVFFETVFSVLVRIVHRVFDGVDSENPILSAIGYLAFGLVAGIASVWLLPHHLVHPSRYHGISLLISPMIAGLIMSQIGSFLRRKDKTTVRIESFLYGFTFALGIAIIRLVFLQ